MGWKLQTHFKKYVKSADRVKCGIEKGYKFYYKDVWKLLDLYFTENEEKSFVIERFTSTIRENIQVFYLNLTRKYTDAWHTLVFIRR